MITVGKQPLTGIAVLLVEDYPMNVRFAKSLLERLGATVDVADNGRDALDKLDASRHQIVLMDIQMPVMDGYEATRLLRARGETLPIIALTADVSAETAAELRTIGLNDSLIKPFRSDTLVEVLLRHLSQNSYYRP